MQLEDMVFSSVGGGGDQVKFEATVVQLLYISLLASFICLITVVCLSWPLSRRTAIQVFSPPLNEAVGVCFTFPFIKIKPCNITLLLGRHQLLSTDLP